MQLIKSCLVVSLKSGCHKPAGAWVICTARVPIKWHIVPQPIAMNQLGKSELVVALVAATTRASQEVLEVRLPVLGRV